jgi:hypothetical protein
VFRGPVWQAVRPLAAGTGPQATTEPGPTAPGTDFSQADGAQVVNEAHRLPSSSACLDDGDVFALPAGNCAVSDRAAAGR